ncbi:MAG: hypothetical protein AABY18_03030 [Candidatus Thermoplasmatota archaeon]
MVSDAFLLTSQFVAAAIFLALAGLILAVRFNGRVNRAFALYLFLQGTALLLLAVVRAWQGQTRAATMEELFPYVALPLPLVLAYFVAVHRAPQGGLAARATGVAVLLLVLVAETMYLVNHATVYSVQGGRPTAGPLFPLFHALPLAQALTGLVLARGALRGDEAKRPATALTALGFTVLALVEGSLVAAAFLTDGAGAFTVGFEANAWIRLERTVRLLALLVSLLSLVVLGSLVWRVQRAGARVTSLVLLGTLALATAAFVTTGELVSQAGVTSSTTFVVGLWRVLGAGLVTYALVRHRFLDLDVRINWTVSRGAVVACFVVTFVVVSKIAENFLNQRFDWAWGGVATGLLVLVLKPLERLGDRVADGLVPRGRAPHELGKAEKLALFREQAFMVWADGMMGRKERLLLDNLRERLSIPAQIAVSIEHEAARGNDGMKPAGLST